MLAVLYDIHGNLPALEAVLEDARDAGADQYLLGGDYTALGGWPLEVLAVLRELPRAEWIRGNWERWLASRGDVPDVPLLQEAAEWTSEKLDGETIAELSRLPQTTALDGTRFSHGSPISDMRSFLPEPADDEEELIDGATEGRLVFGHTHVQFRRQGPGGVDLVNPGSVGMPFDGDPRAAYALVSGDGELELRRVSYDHEAAAAEVRRRMPGFADDVAERLTTAMPPQQ